MKTFLLTLTLFAFLQSAFLPVNLVLICIISRSLILHEKSNYYLAFFGGLILSFLTQDNLGYWPLVLIVVVKICYFIVRLPISLTPLTVIFYSGMIIFLVGLLNTYFSHTYFDLNLRVIETIIAVPAFFIIKNWEDRFVVKRNIKLKV